MVNGLRNPYRYSHGVMKTPLKKEETTKVAHTKKLEKGVNKKAAALTVLNDASLSTTQKVDKLLKIKQKMH